MSAERSWEHRVVFVWSEECSFCLRSFVECKAYFLSTEKRGVHAQLPDLPFWILSQSLIRGSALSSSRSSETELGVLFLEFVHVAAVQLFSF